MAPARVPFAVLASAALASAALVSAAPFEYHELTDPSALCLDGSPYGFSLCRAAKNVSLWEIDIQGGG